MTFLTDSKTLKEEKREELFENLKSDGSIGWDVDVIDPRELSAKMLKKSVQGPYHMGSLVSGPLLSTHNASFQSQNKSQPK